MQNRTELIQSRLEAAFSPTYLQVSNESEHHRGHAGYTSGETHFAIVIAAPIFSTLSRVEAHRKIYALFSDLIPEKIHALNIKIID